MTKIETNTTMIPAATMPMQQVAMQSYAPMATRRSLDADEVEAVAAGMQRWIPKIAPGYSTPIPELLGSPKKAALLGASPGILLGLLSGAAKALGDGQAAASLGSFGCLTAIAGAAIGYFARRNRNETVLDLMQRSPKGATYRDMLSDAVYQRDLDRRSAHASSAAQTALLTAGAYSLGRSNRQR